MIERQSKTKRPLLTRLGNWLRAVVRKEQLADPQWDEEVRREQTGQMGENLHTAEEMRSADPLPGERTIPHAPPPPAR